jgi:23S rRNA (adenine2503-C2)-methyltransferase
VITALRSAAVASDGTARYSVTADDGAAFEAVFQPWRGDSTICMSAQAGCGYGCAHCATTYADVQFRRSLTADEIVDTVTRIAAVHGDGRVRTVDFSGTGDASRNWVAVSEALRRLRVTGVCRTVGVTSVAPQRWVRQLLASDETHWPDELLFSLHGATREARRLVVTNGEDPARAIDGWSDVAVRGSVTLSYVMHEGNTRQNDLEALVGLLGPHEGFSGLRLTPLNGVAGIALVPAQDPDGFVTAVRDALPAWQVRTVDPMGLDVDAGCGQLRVR